MLQYFKTLSQSKRMFIVVAALEFIISGGSGGCGAYERPAALTTEERALLRAAPLPYAVTVAWWDENTKTGKDREAYGDALAKLVTASGAFNIARYERSSMPSGQDLVATSTGLYCNSAVIPLLSIISLGVIPTIIQDEYCEGMLLRTDAGRLKTDGVVIELRHRGPVIMGWIAVVVGMLPGWSHGSVERDPRFAERFRLAVIRRQTDIARLAGH